MLRIGSLLATAVLWAMPAQAGNMVINVGPGGQYHRIDAAVAKADADTDLRNYYTINIAPGIYQNDFPEVTRPMTIQVHPALPSQRAALKATIPLPNQKGIILTTSSLHVNGLILEGAQIDASLGNNGAGIRDQNPENTPAHLIVENTIFRNNQTGILQGNDIAESITIINSQFQNNGAGRPHALYINTAASLTVTDSLFCGQLGGHNIKSRAAVTNIFSSRIYDGAAAPPETGCRTGSSSFAIDIANGGVAVIEGNLIVQGPASPNQTMVLYGGEGLDYNVNRLFVAHNQFINTRPGAGSTGVWDYPCAPFQLANNNFSGLPYPFYPDRCATVVATHGSQLQVR